MSNSEPVARLEGIPDTDKTQTIGQCQFQNCGRANWEVGEATVRSCGCVPCEVHTYLPE